MVFQYVVGSTATCPKVMENFEAHGLVLDSSKNAYAGSDPTETVLRVHS